MIRSLLIAMALFIAACTTSTYSVPPEDRAAIAARIASFERTFVNNNTTEIVNVVPPYLITAIAAEGGVSEALLRSEMAKLTRQATREVKVISFGMNLDQAQFLTTPTGRPYGLIQTQTQTVVQTKGGTKVQSNNNTLTLQAGGKWYLIHIDEGRQMELIREAYPGFKNVTFPEGTTKVIG